MMASRSNSLLTLRLLVIVATLIFLRKLYYEIQWEFNEGANEGPRSTPIDWRSIDIEKPSLTNNTVYERLRLNEFLAVPQYKCNDSLQPGDALESFTVCKENGPFENVLVITGNSLSSGKFERDLEVEGASKWTIFLPESSDLVNQLKGDVEVHYLTELARWDGWSTWDMEVAVKGRTYDVAKMELFAFQFQAYDQPNVVRQLVQNMTARHLALTINVDSSTKPQTTRVLGEWYQLLYWLFYSQGYALIGASSSGICGIETQNCVYRVSLMRVESAKDRLQLSAPVFGLGSPKEELGRLVSYLHKSECSTSASSEFPLFCSDILHEQSTVLLVTYRKFKREEIPVALAQLRNFHITTPHAIEDRGDLNIHNFAIQSEQGAEQRKSDHWKTEELGTLMKRIFGEPAVDLLLLDLQGGEVGVYKRLLQLASNFRFNQLAVRGHIWTEENENIRAVYWGLRQLENYGYSLMIGKADLPRYDAAFVKK